MPLLKDFERRLEGLVEGFFAKAFRAGVQPVELAKRLLRDMDANQTVGVNGVWVPNRYVFYLSPEDRARFEQAEQALGHELRQLAREGAAERGWKLLGPAEVAFETDAGLGKGEFRSEAILVEGPDRPITGQSRAVPARGASARSAPAAAGQLVHIEDGRALESYPLDKDVVVLGRLSECDVVLADPGASRRHAEIRREDSSYVIIDLGSTNGTMVNEATIGERRLEEGDRITIGRTVFEFRGA